MTKYLLFKPNLRTIIAYQSHFPRYKGSVIDKVVLSKRRKYLFWGKPNPETNDVFLDAMTPHHLHHGHVCDK